MSQVTNSILFRQKLYQNFKQSGLLSELQTNLRTSLLSQLQKPQKSQDPIPEQNKKPLHLRDKFLACVVREYLIKSKKQYTLSILLPESNLEEYDCLNFNQMAELVNLHTKENCWEWESMSFLEVLICQWVRIRAAENCQRSTQTDFSQPVSKKLDDIEKQYRPKMEYWKLMTAPKTQSSQNLSILQKQQRMREDLELQKKTLRRQLQVSVRAQIQKKYQQKYQFQTKQLQKQYQIRLSQLKSRQKSIIESLQKKTKQIEQKLKNINEGQLKMIKKYQEKMRELDIEHCSQIKLIQEKQKQFWKKELQLKAKKRQYQDAIRLVKNQIIQETLHTGKEE